MTHNLWVRGEDPDFEEVIQKIHEFKASMIDVDRLFDLWATVEQVKPLKGSFMEVGVWCGGSGGLMLKRVRDLGITDSVYLCDTFRGVVKAGENDSHYKGGEHANASVAQVHRFINDGLKIEQDQYKVLEGIFPDETAKGIPEDEKFRMCHIDVDVYQSAKDIYNWIWPKMVIGGVLIYDDYGYFNECAGIGKHISELSQDSDKLLIRSPNRHCFIVKISEVSCPRLQSNEKIKPLKLWLDDRGYLYEILRCDDPMFTQFGQYYVSSTNPGVVKGFHKHNRQIDYIACVQGQIKLVLIRIIDGVPVVEEHHLSPLDPKMVVVEQGVYHGWMCVGNEPALVVNATSLPHDRNNPDEERVDPHSNPWGYVWEIKDK